MSHDQLIIKYLRAMGWRIPNLASCLRCRLSGGDHHRCWIDRCPANHVREV